MFSPKRLIAALIWILLKPFKILITNPIKRRGEFEADEFGFKFMINAGFNPQDALEFWDYLEAINPTIDSLQFLSDHPSHIERKQRMERSLSRHFKDFD